MTLHGPSPWTDRIAAALVAGAILCGVAATIRSGSPPRETSIALDNAPSGAVLDVASGHLFVVEGPAGRVAVLDSRSGRLLHTIAVAPELGAAALDGAAGRLFVTSGSHGGLLAALDTHTGRVLWRRALPDPRALAVDQAHDLALVTAYATSQVFAIDEATGRLLRAIAVNCCPVALAQDRGHAVVISREAFGMDGYASVIDLPGGRVLGSYTMNLLSDAIAVEARQGLAYVNGGSPNGNDVSALDTRTGALLHTYAVGLGPFSLATDPASGRAIVASATSGTLSLLDAHAARPVRTIPMPANPTLLVDDPSRAHALVLSQSFGADGTARGQLTIVDARGGAILRRAPAGDNPGALALDAPRDLALVLGQGASPADELPGRGTLRIFAAGTGALLRTVTVGLNPIAVLVDTRAGHAFVLNAGGRLRLPDRLGWLPRGLHALLPFLHSGQSRSYPPSISVVSLPLRV